MERRSLCRRGQTGCVWFLTLRREQLDDPGLVTSPVGAVVSTVIMTPSCIVTVRIRIISVKSLACADDMMDTQ